MTPEDIARAIVYSIVALPALLFVLLYVFLLPRLRVTAETLHLIAFTAVVGYIAVDFGAAAAFHWWGFSLPRFLAVMTFVSILLWQRFYLLTKHGLKPRLRAARASRNQVEQPVD